MHSLLDGARLSDLQDVLSEKIIGQQDAVEQVVHSLIRLQTGLHLHERPLASLLFAGMSGVGKTLMARCLSEYLFGSDLLLLELEMGDYRERLDVLPLIGSSSNPHHGGLLTSFVQHHPASIVLFSGLEKAHPDIFLLLKEIQTRGYLRDAMGRKCDFRNVILIATFHPSHSLIHAIWTRNRQGHSGGRRHGFSGSELKRIMKLEAETCFPAPFLEHLDEVVPFRPLAREDLEQIMEHRLLGLRAQFGPQHQDIQIHSSARELLLNLSNWEYHGAASFSEVIHYHLEIPLRRFILSGVVTPDSQITVVQSEVNPTLLSFRF